MTQTDILVAGAGPAGLTLACDLARHGAAVRIIDRPQELRDGSRSQELSPARRQRRVKISIRFREAGMIHSARLLRTSPRYS
ncbi:MAG TPA: FAD-dependent monooxygenase [Streptosporangiaceae bacterium]